MPNSLGNKTIFFEIAFDLNEMMLCGMMRRRFARSLVNFSRRLVIMGEYRVKSGKNMPSIHGASLPSIPKIGALNRNQSSSAISEMESLDFMTSDEPTDIRSADDILAAVGGIDGWDNVPEDAGAAYVTSENRSIAESLDDLMALDDEMTTVTNRSSSITPASEFNIPSQRVPIIRGASPAAVPAAAATDETMAIDMPSADSSKTEMVESPFMNAELAAALAATPVSKPIPIPGTGAASNAASATPSTQMPSAPHPSPSVQMPPAAPATPSVHMPPAAPATPSVQMPPAAPATPSVQMPPAAPATPSVQMPPAAPAAPSVQVPQTPSGYAQPAAPQRELSDEEQLMALYESMTPEERAEYEQYSLQQQQAEAEQRRAKQRELMEMYGNPGMTQQKNSGGPVLAIIIILVLAAAGVGFYFLAFSGPSEAEIQAEQQKKQEEVVEVPKPVVEKVHLSTYPVNIKTGGASTIFINGVEVSPTGSFEFVSNHRNTIMAYADGMVPFFKTFDSKTDVTGPIEIEMIPDSLYLKGRIDFRLTDISNQGVGLKAMLDGRAIGNFPSAVSEVVLGRPHVLTIEKPGFAKHMHIIWPVHPDTTVTIPALVPEDSALMGTKCALKKFAPSSKPYGLKISTGGQDYVRPIVATVQPGDIIEYYITHDQRLPLQVSVIPDGFGSLNLDTNLLRESIGESIVKFNSSEEGLRVCLRRAGELICPDMTQESTVPSGPDWEFLGATGTEGNLRPVRGGQEQELQSSRKYTFDVGLDAKGTFTLKQSGYDRIKKPEAK